MYSIHCVNFLYEKVQIHKLTHSFNLFESKSLNPGQDLDYVEVVLNCEEIHEISFHEFLKKTSSLPLRSQERDPPDLFLTVKSSCFFLSEQTFEQTHSLLEIAKK